VSAASPQVRGLNRQEISRYGLITAVAVLAGILHFVHAAPVLVFVVAGIAVAGMAYVLGDATEEAGEVAGPRISALLNATFGNAAELIIVILSIRSGLIDVARASIVGSVIGNVLLILGASMLASGIRFGYRSFDRAVAGRNVTMLVLAGAVLGLPTLYATTRGSSLGNERSLSHWVAIVAVVVYAAYLYASFQHPEEAHESGEGDGSARWSTRLAITMLGFSAVATALLSEVLVDAIKPTIEKTGISPLFVGLIVVPLVGNVAEHFAAVKLAWHGHLDFAIGIAFNSALQVALAVSAVAVFAGWFFGGDRELTLTFTALEIAILGISTILAGLIAANSQASWIEGFQLIALYVLSGFVLYYAR
jgi:Ca2+:H+ antiporter